MVSVATGSIRLEPMDSLTDLASEIAGLQGLDTDELRIRWCELYGCPPIARMSRDLLIRAIAHRLQERTHSGMSKKARRDLTRHMRALQQTGSISQSKQAGIKNGTNLIREWNGKVHRVEVIGNGFVWNGENHRSLSSIARAITGTRWSGPRFFGLNEQKAGQGKFASASAT